LLSEIQEKSSNKKIKILTVGHLRWYKNPILWIKVAEIVSKSIGEENIEFIWSGDGELMKECQEIAKSKKLGNIIFAGYQKDIENIIRSCDIYFQPSVVESFGLSVLDAMRLGKPCIISNRGGLPEVVKNNETGFVIDINNKEEMAEKIIVLIKNKDLRLEMGKAGAKRYERNFSFEIWKEKMIRLQDSLY